jgi:hypothetical protein
MKNSFARSHKEAAFPFVTEILLCVFSEAMNVSKTASGTELWTG